MGAAGSGKAAFANGPQRVGVAVGSALAPLSGDLEWLRSILSRLAASVSILQKPVGGLSVLPSPMAAAEAARTTEQANGDTRHL